jgi:hypothetical protein
MIKQVTRGRAVIVAAAIVSGLSMTVSVRQAAAPAVAAPADPLLAGFARSTVAAVLADMPCRIAGVSLMSARPFRSHRIC